MLEQVKDFIQPELLILVPVLYILGMGLKQSNVKDKYIPTFIGLMAITLSVVYVFGTTGLSFLGLFTAVTQAILCAGASTYINQILKQVNKDE